MRPNRQRPLGAAPEQVSAADLPLPVDGLCDVVLVRTDDGGLARPEDHGTALTPQEVAAHARAAGVAGCDLRVLVDDGARDAALFGQVASALGCDILVTPAGATVRRLAGPSLAGRAEAVPIDRISGEVVDWVLVQPTALRTTLPGWFDLAGGLVLPRSGLATLPLAGGLEFANREDFVVRRAAASRLGVGHPDLMTVALATRAGQFRLSTYRLDAAGENPGRYSGQDVAAVLSSTYLYGGDLRVWLRWPDDPVQCQRLDAQVTALAEATGATVWTPEIGSEAVLLRGCLDLAARDRAGMVARWREYRPPYAADTPRFAADRDGRLGPSGGPVVSAAGGVALISTERASEAALLDRYVDLSAEPGLMLVDLTILDGGRLALRYQDGSHLAVGAVELRALLTNAGWRGADLQLLTPVAPEWTEGLREHLDVLESDLGVEIWSLTPGAVVVVRDGLARAVDEQRRPARWLRAADPGQPAETGRWRNDDGWLIPRRRGAGESPGPSPAAPPSAAPPPAAPATALPPAAPAAAPATPAPAAAAPPPDRVLPAPSPRPALTVSAPGGRPHGLRWLPERPEVNAEPVRLWLASPWSPRRVAIEGVPSANLFLVGDLDGERVARAHPYQHLLCLRVEAGGLVDLDRVGDLPAGHLGTRPAGTFLLPAGWLDQARLRAGYDVDDDGRPQEETELPGSAVVLRCTGARHGTDGLPDDVVRWPGGARGAGAWALVPDSPVESPDDFLPLHQRRPPVRDGHRLVRLRLVAGEAIDTRASAAALSALTSVRSRLPELVAEGVTLLLPQGCYDGARVDQVLHADGGRWRQRTKGIDQPLSSFLAPLGPRPEPDRRRPQPLR
ncbi:hypothetical protein [Micromonospora sp. NPDC085948]|uniref:hypothetical protein n=1 Tax=Micromonospora sp. NPDC085948 TaxID=3155293 RepID=UPI0034416881